jgi:hypothetical protein
MMEALGTVYAGNVDLPRVPNRGVNGREMEKTHFLKLGLLVKQGQKG